MGHIVCPWDLHIISIELAPDMFLDVAIAKQKSCSHDNGDFNLIGGIQFAGI